MGVDNKEKKSILQMDLGDIFKGFKKKNQDKEKEKKATKKKEKKVVSKKALAIDIGSDNVKFVFGRYIKGKVIIEKAFEVKTPKGCIEDGHIKDMEVLSGTLNDAIRVHKIKNDNIIFTTNSTAIINRTIIVPKVEEEELESVINYEIQQYLPIKLDEYMVQYNVLRDIVVEGNDKLEVLIVVYPNRMIFSYAELVSKIGGKPYALDVNYNSKRKALNVMNPENNETIISVDLGARHVCLTVIDKGNLFLMKAINSGGTYLDEYISKTLKIPLDRVYTEKTENCNLMSREERPLEHCVKEVVDTWFDEVNRVIKYYQNKNKDGKVDKIYLTGGSSNLKGLERYVGSKIDLRVKILQENSNIEFKKGVDEVKISEYINAIGALIRL